MSEFGGLYKHENNQQALVPPKTECGWPSGGGIKNSHIRYPSYWRMKGEKTQLPLLEYGVVDEKIKLQ